MSVICIQWKSSRFLSPVSTVAARNAWNHNRRSVPNAKKKNHLEIMSLTAYASKTNKFAEEDVEEPTTIDSKEIDDGHSMAETDTEPREKWLSWGSRIED